jgi:hypothetical protein
LWYLMNPKAHGRFVHQPDISGWLSTQNCKCESSLFCFTISSKYQISGNRFVIVSFVFLTWTVVLPTSFFCNIMWLLTEYIIGNCRRNSEFGSRIHGSGHRQQDISALVADPNWIMRNISGKIAFLWTAKEIYGYVKMELE